MSKNPLVLTKRKLATALIIFIIAIILHNLIYGLTGAKDTVFFVIAYTFIPAYLLSTVICTSLHNRGCHKTEQVRIKSAKRRK